MEMDFDLEKDDGNWGIEVYCEAVLQFQAFVQAHKLNLIHNFIKDLSRFWFSDRFTGLRTVGSSSHRQRTSPERVFVIYNYVLHPPHKAQWLITANEDIWINRIFALFSFWKKSPESRRSNNSNECAVIYVVGPALAAGNTSREDRRLDEGKMKGMGAGTELVILQHYLLGQRWLLIQQDSPSQAIECWKTEIGVKAGLNTFLLGHHSLKLILTTVGFKLTPLRKYGNGAYNGVNIITAPAVPLYPPLLEDRNQGPVIPFCPVFADDGTQKPPISAENFGRRRHHTSTYSPRVVSPGPRLYVPPVRPEQQFWGQPPFTVGAYTYPSEYYQNFGSGYFG
ncbi:hypothetical protein BT96DRAFT_987177 [Gymnopus androsaceus JB14]|uniref:Uncharacterized protein n=1 Tax=Gymnopus androsaceus JB14 TaxID=1447944 RepID=A0A6A4I894_9AGAR|nr:hypothetical protein BT96DRAFT_987177 [Gymnopus androsaceus JB14]